MNTHEVVRNLPGPEGIIEPGTKVDASGWRNTRLLETHRYLKPLREKKPKAKGDAHDGHQSDQ